MFVEERPKLNAQSFQEFLEHYLSFVPPDVKVHLVLDNARAHHAKALKPFLASNQDRLQLHFLPAYSPDLNPIEWVWKHFKGRYVFNHHFSTIEELRAHLTPILHSYLSGDGEIQDLTMRYFKSDK